MPITHAKVSAKSDGGDTTLVRPSDWNAEHVGDLGSMVLIDEVIVTGSVSAQMNLIDIPSTYKDLVIVITARSNNAAIDGTLLQVGGAAIDTGSNYRYQRDSSGSGNVATNSTSATSVQIGMATQTGAAAGNFTVTTVELFNYADTTIWRTMHNKAGYHDSDRYYNWGQGTWMNTTDAIQRVRATLSLGSFAIGSRMVIYGRGGPGISTPADDPVSDVFGPPDVAYEFNSASFTGLTALGTPSSEDIDTTVPGHYYARHATNASPFIRGRGATVTAPFTAITRVTSAHVRNYEQAGFILAPSTYPSSGAFDFFAVGHGTNTNRVGLEAWSAPGTYSGTPDNAGSAFMVGPVYLAIVANSNTDVDYYWSLDGRIWRKLTDARNPGITIGFVGPAGSAQNITGFAAAWEFLRIWNSALTIPGI